MWYLTINPDKKINKCQKSISIRNEKLDECYQETKTTDLRSKSKTKMGSYFEYYILNGSKLCLSLASSAIKPIKCHMGQKDNSKSEHIQC